MNQKFDIRNVIVADVPQEHTNKVIKALLSQLTENLLAGNTVYVPKICNLMCKEYSARNAKIGDKLFAIPNRKLLRLEALKTFRKKC